MAKICVTGGAGYVGSHTANRLLQAGFEVLVVDNLSTGFRASVAKNVDFIEADVRDFAALNTILNKHRVDCVIHCAAMLNVAESIQKPLEYYDNNVNGMLSLLRACEMNAIDKIVFSSSGTIYGNESPLQLIKEDSPLKPISPYGFSKLFCEQLLADVVRKGIRSVVLRYFNAAGATVDLTNGQRTLHAYHLIHLAAQAAVGSREGVAIFGVDYPTEDGSCIRDYIHIDDLAEIHLLSVRHLFNGGSSEVFNCGYGTGFSVKQVVNTMQLVSGTNFPIKESPRRPGDPACLIANPEKIKSKLQWFPKHDSLKTICRSAYEWEMLTFQHNTMLLSGR